MIPNLKNLGLGSFGVGVRRLDPQRSMSSATNWMKLSDDNSIKIMKLLTLSDIAHMQEVSHHFYDSVIVNQAFLGQAVESCLLEKRFLLGLSTQELVFLHLAVLPRRRVTAGRRGLFFINSTNQLLYFGILTVSVFKAPRLIDSLKDEMVQSVANSTCISDMYLSRKENAWSLLVTKSGEAFVWDQDLHENPQKIYDCEALKYVACAVGDQSGMLLTVNGQVRLYPENRTILNNIPIIRISCGSDHNMVVSMNGDVYTFGKVYQKFHEYWESEVPMKINGLPQVSEISCGHNHSLFLSVTGNVYSLGRNDFGQCGYEGSISSKDRGLTAKEINFFYGIKLNAISAGKEFSLVVTETGLLYSFGNNDFGQLGHGNTESTHKPQRLNAFKNDQYVTEVSTGALHSLCVLSSGEVYGWGSREGTRHNYMDSYEGIDMTPVKYKNFEMTPNL